jgi:hypothetical protein
MFICAFFLICGISVLKVFSFFYCDQVLENQFIFVNEKIKNKNYLIASENQYSKK